jgi:hypothetical protein
VPRPLRGGLRPAGQRGSFRAGLRGVGVGVAEPLARRLLGRLRQLAVGLGEQVGRNERACPLHRETRQAARRQHLVVGLGCGEGAEGGRQVAGQYVHAAQVDPAERRVQGQVVPGRELPAPAEICPGQGDVVCLQVHEAAVVEHLDQVQRDWPAEGWLGGVGRRRAGLRGTPRKYCSGWYLLRAWPPLIDRSRGAGPL